jgi:hypothetical protein
MERAKVMYILMADGSLPKRLRERYHDITFRLANDSVLQVSVCAISSESLYGLNLRVSKVPVQVLRKQYPF